MSQSPSSQTPAPSSTSPPLVSSTTTVPSILNNLDSTDEVIDDTDQRVVYSGSWVQNLNEGGVPSGTSHSTLVTGSSILLNFNGTGVDVLGVVPTGSQVIHATYVVDDDAQYRSVSGSEIAVACQTFFSVRGLNFGPHILKLMVTNGTNPRLFVIDAFVVSNSPGTGPTVAISGSGSTTSGSVTTTVAASAASASSNSSTTSTAQSSSLENILNVSSTSPTSSPAGVTTSFAESSSANPSSPDLLSASGAHSMSGGKIAGTVIGSLVGLILLIGLILTLCRWRSIRKRRTPNPDTAPRPLFTSRPKSSYSGEIGGEKAHVGNDFKLLPPPKYAIKKSTSPGPPSEASGEWVSTFGPDIQRPRRKS